MSPEVEQIILSGQVSEYDIETLAVQQGMVTMVQDGILKALDGITSVEEVFKVVE
jgi:type II secretory ATPase GspE/PulE/Tfp pilus assembly ATPase PilB-like protein